MRSFKGVVAVGAGLFMATSAIGMAQDGADEASFYEFFRKTCVLNVPRLDKVNATARILGWPELSGDLATILAPANPNVSFRGWSAIDKNRTILVAVSEGVLDSQRVATCTVMGRGLDRDITASIIERETGGRLDFSEEEHGQRYLGWKSMKDGEPIMIHLTASAKDRVSAATLAVLSFVQGR